MKKQLLLTLLVLLLVCCKKDNSKLTYYKDDETGKILNQKEYNELKEWIKAQFLEISKVVEVNENFTDNVVSKDSIIKTYKLKIEISDQVSNLGKEKVFNYLNQKLPSENLQTIDNNNVNLKDFLGKPVVLNFWFIACKPCVDEIPVLNKIMKKYEDKVNFISITFDKKESVELFLKKNQFDFIKVIDAENFIQQIGVKAFPKNIFIDKNGIVRKIENGIPSMSENGKMKIGSGEKFEKYIKELL